MNVLLALKLTSDSLMVAEAVALKNAPSIDKLHLLTDKRYSTRVEGVDYHFLSPWISRIPILRVFARIPKMIGICRREKIDLLICYHLTSYGFAGLVVSNLLGIPLSLHFLGKDIDELCRKPVIGSFVLKCAGTIDVLTVQGSKSRRFLESKGLGRIHIIPTACDLTKFLPRDSPKKEYDVIFLGRLGKEKRVDRFVEIIHIIHVKGCDIRAAVVGTGPEEKEMLHQIKTLGMERYIEYVGWTDAVADYLSKAKVFLLTSDNDQLPSTLLEAMAMGVVPVASDVGNVSDVVDNKSGFIIDKSNTAGFAEAVISLLTNKPMYSEMSLHCLERVEKFSLEANSKRWEAVLRDIAENNA